MANLHTVYCFLENPLPNRVDSERRILGKGMRERTKESRIAAVMAMPPCTRLKGILRSAAPAP